MINPATNKKEIIDVVKYRWVFLALSALLLIPCIGAMIFSSVKYENHLPFRVGIDFVGGTIFQYSSPENVSEEKVASIREGLEKAGVESPVIQILHTADVASKNAEKAESQEKTAEQTGEKIDSLISIRTAFDDGTGLKDKVENAVVEVVPESKLVSVNSIGPTLGKELFKNSLIALLLAFVGIVCYLSYRFQMDYAIIAMLALVHDALFVMGVFSILGLVNGVHIDALFLTGILTVIGFSVHDTIVVYDRIRENCKYFGKKLSFNEITNASVNQTLARSINTSVSTLLTLLALYFFGGVTTKDFVLVMILGILIGTYSSIFFASTILAMVKSRQGEKATVGA